MSGSAMYKSESTQTKQTKGLKPGWNLMESDVVFLLLPLVLTVFVPTGALLYVFGRLSWHAGLLGLFHLAAIGFIFFCFVASAVRLLLGWRRYTGKRKLLGIAGIAIPIVFGMLCVIGSPVLTKSRMWPDATPFTYGFRDRIRSKADIPALRAWLRTFNKSAYEEPGDRVPPDQWPESLKALKPPWRVFLEPDKKGNPQIRIVWGGAIFHWGLTIGTEDMEIPPSQLDEFEAWLLLEPGVYVYEW